jgi:hypothetical protein
MERLDVNIKRSSFSISYVPRMPALYVTQFYKEFCFGNINNAMAFFTNPSESKEEKRSQN